MARKYEIADGEFAWNFEQCEEIVLIDLFDKIKPFILPEAAWRPDFEYHFFQHGNGILARFLDEINAVARRRGLETFTVRETDVFDYGRTPNKLMKSEHRKRVLEELLNASYDARVERVNVAREAVAQLPPPHQVYEEYKKKREWLSATSRASREEVSRRRAALDNAARPAPKSSTLELDKAVTMLQFASSADLRDDIIRRLSSEEAVNALPLIEDAATRDALIRHSLSMMG